MYIRSHKRIKTIIVNINRRKKNLINPISFFPNYFKYPNSVVSPSKIRSIYIKPRYKQSF